jgi:hypothetical protein
MSRSFLWWTAKVLEGVGMLVVLIGVFFSMSLGFEGRGLESMTYEFKGLFLGGALFLAGFILERRIGAR